MMTIDKNELNIYEVEALHKDLLNLFNNADVIVDMSKVNKIDMSVLQLLHATQKSCMQASKVFQLKNINKELLKIFHSAGCESLVGNSND